MKRRPVWFHPEKPTNCAIHHRAELDGGASLAGPAVIEETDSTTLLHPGDRLRLGKAGILHIDFGGVA
jgi:N-methylhydantoinase A/oxoprolinase/acetone carboxylase beta subunit